MEWSFLAMVTGLLLVFGSILIEEKLREPIRIPWVPYGFSIYVSGLIAFMIGFFSFFLL